MTTRPPTPTEPNKVARCPFCGGANISDGEVLTSSGVKGGLHAVTQSQCMDCGAIGPEAPLEDGEPDYGDEKAIAAWNRRAAVPPEAPEAMPTEPVAWMAEDGAGYRGLTFINPQTAEGAWDGFTITPLYAVPALPVPPTEWLIEAERLAIKFAHSYSFVRDGSMMKAKAALLSHLRTAPRQPDSYGAFLADLKTAGPQTSAAVARAFGPPNTETRGYCRAIVCACRGGSGDTDCSNWEPK